PMFRYPGQYIAVWKPPGPGPESDFTQAGSEYDHQRWSRPPKPVPQATQSCIGTELGISSSSGHRLSP
ncbi:MAG: hypothetical protein PHG55_05230, partial [Verrucomicrobiota bacterium]|nr:hypothetical protein [Verrucomicrobiota bacterium]